MEETDMLFKFNKSTKEIQPIDETNFSLHNILERQDIEKWVEQYPELLGEKMLIITTEYSDFDKTDERLDILAIDRKGKLVVVELKRDDSGKNVELQAIKYAAYCSTFDLNDIVNIRQEYLLKKGIKESNQETKNFFRNFLNNDFESIDNKPRIILAAKEFRPEVAATVTWLNQEIKMDISCVKITPYEINDEEIFIVTRKIIPPPEAEQYLIRAREKEEKTLTKTQEEYMKFFSNISRKLSSSLGKNLPSAGPYGIYKIPTSMTGVHFEYGFHNRYNRELWVELHFEKSKLRENQEMLKKMLKFKDELEKSLNHKIESEEKWSVNWCRLFIKNGAEEVNDELLEWAIQKMEIMYNILNPKLEKM